VRAGGAAPVRLTVVGITGDTSALPSGILTLRNDLPALAGTEPTSFLFKTGPGRDPSQAAGGLELSFGQRGFQASVVGEGVRNVQTVRRLLSYLLEGFIAMGLVSGMAALGVISSRAVMERRQEIGMLRAIGVRRRQVQAGFLLEVSLVAWLGAGVGTALALLLARNIVDFLAVNFHELRVTVPWTQVGLIALVAYAVAMAATFWPASQAGRITPAEALRYE
jgi:putative ABC transport system permease protein